MAEERVGGGAVYLKAKFVGGVGVACSVVDEERLLGAHTRTADHLLEDGWRGLEHLHLLGEVDAVETLLNIAPCGCKVAAYGIECHAVGVREYIGLIATAAKLLD